MKIILSFFSFLPDSVNVKISLSVCAPDLDPRDAAALCNHNKQTLGILCLWETQPALRKTQLPALFSLGKSSDNTDDIPQMVCTNSEEDPDPVQKTELHQHVPGATLIESSLQ